MVKKRIAINDRGVFLVSSKKLSVKDIKKKRVYLEREVINLHSMNRQILREKLQNEQRIKELEQQIQDLKRPEVEALIEQERLRLEEVKNKAQQFMHDVLGDEMYKTMLLKGHVIFEAKDGHKYKISRRGRAYRKIGGRFQELCILRPDLPVPDVIASVLVSVTENPKGYQLRR